MQVLESGVSPHPHNGLVGVVSHLRGDNKAQESLTRRKHPARWFWLILKGTVSQTGVCLAGWGQGRAKVSQRTKAGTVLCWKPTSTPMENAPGQPCPALTSVSQWFFPLWFVLERGDDHALGVWSPNAPQVPRKGSSSNVLCKYNRLSVGQGPGEGWP